MRSDYRCGCDKGGEQTSKKLPLGDSQCRNHGDAGSVWIWYSSGKPANHCLLVYRHQKCYGDFVGKQHNCPMAGYDIQTMMDEKNNEKGEKKGGVCRKLKRSKYVEGKAWDGNSYAVVEVSPRR